MTAGHSEEIDVPLAHQIGRGTHEPQLSSSMRDTTSTGPTSMRSFARHFAEMVVAMLLGMGVLGGLASLAFSMAGARLMDQPGAVQVMLMGLSMTVPMVVWMRYRGHPARRTGEMAASMLVPSALAAVLAAAGLLGAEAALSVQHAVMLPAMLGVMLWRYDEYARPHAGSSVARRRPGRPEAPPAGP